MASCTVYLLTVLLVTIVDGRAVDKAPCSILGVGITVSSLAANTEILRQLEVNWWNADPLDGDLVALFDADPSDGGDPLFTHALQGGDVNGFIGAGLGVNTTVSSELGFTKRCLGYWAAYLRGTEILASGCLSTQPTWMWDLRSELQDMKLTELFLPGTHDASSYKDYAPIDENPVTKYAVTQEEDILSQLIHGVRYMDIRITHFPDREEVWWTNHGAVPMYPLSVILEQVRQFIDNTEEVVVFDIHSITGFDSVAIHESFFEFLAAAVSDVTASSTLTWSTTLGDVWRFQRRLIVTYPVDEMVGLNEMLWPTVRHMWANANNIDDLYDYLAGVMLAPPPNTRQWSAMVELTATPLDVVTDVLGGLRRMADSVNHNVTLWFQGTWGETVNVVAADFFRGTAIVEESIEWNIRRASASPCFKVPPHPSATSKENQQAS